MGWSGNLDEGFGSEGKSSRLVVDRVSVLEAESKIMSIMNLYLRY